LRKGEKSVQVKGLNTNGHLEIGLDQIYRANKQNKKPKRDGCIYKEKGVIFLQPLKYASAHVSPSHVLADLLFIEQLWEVDAVNTDILQTRTLRHRIK